VNQRLHNDARRIIQKLQRERISALYHFTSIENLRLIREMNALCSKQALEEAGRWPVPEPGGNTLSHDLDRYNGNWDKVSLNFTPYTPMAYNKKREGHLCFFLIQPCVAGFDGVVFTDTNATRTSDQHRAEGLEGLALVDFKAVRSSPRPWDKEGWFRPVQAEVLVPNRIDLRWVAKIVFVSNASLQEAERLWGNNPHPPFEVERQCFCDTPSSKIPSFSFLSKIILTDDHVDESNINQSRPHKVRFCRRLSKRITLVASVYATTGTLAEILWQPVQRSQQDEFETTSNYWHWPSIPIGVFPDGRCSVEYRLGGIRWATLEFEVYP